MGMKVIVPSARISLCIQGYCWDWNWITFDDLKAIHFFDSSFSILNIFILNECKTFALTCLWISVNINIIDFTKWLKKLFQLAFWHLREFSLQTSHLYFGQSSFLLSLLLVRIDLLSHFHLSKLRKKYFAAAAALFFSAWECWILRPVNYLPLTSIGLYFIVKAFSTD